MTYKEQRLLDCVQQTKINREYWAGFCSKSKSLDLMFGLFFSWRAILQK